LGLTFWKLHLISLSLYQKIIIVIKLIKAKRSSKFENRYHPKMGRVNAQVTRIQKAFLGVLPIKTIHKYRETYQGEIKDCKACNLSYKPS
jgi:hypothetical protein